MPLEQHQLHIRLTTISPSIGSIKLDLTLDVGGQQSCIVVTSFNCHHHSSFKDIHEAPLCPKPPLQCSHDQKCKKNGHMKKSLSLGIIGEEKLENSLAFSRGEEEEEEGTCTSSKGQFDGSHPNDQTIDNPLKKRKT
jgi:hypothetical protein